MFNAIQDAVFVVKASTLKFVNFYAKELVGQTDGTLDTPFLYLFSDVEEETLTRTIVREGKMLTAKDIL